MTNAYSNWLRLIRAARGLEAGGFYNAAKLLWAALYASEIKAAGGEVIPKGEDLDRDLAAILDEWRTTGVNPALVAALEKGRAAVREDRTIPYDDIPAVSVSRTTGDMFLGDPPEFTDNHDHRLGLRSFTPVWYLEPLSRHEALAALEYGPALIEAEIVGLTLEQMTMITPAPGEWTMRELLNHLMMSQELFAARVDKILSETNPSLEGMAVWAMTQKLLSPDQIVERYRASREHTVARLKAISPEDWRRAGQHSEWGRQTVLDQATYFARHEASHMPQFAQIRRAIEKAE